MKPSSEGAEQYIQKSEKNGKSLVEKVKDSVPDERTMVVSTHGSDKKLVRTLICIGKKSSCIKFRYVKKPWDLNHQCVLLK